MEAFPVPGGRVASFDVSVPVAGLAPGDVHRVTVGFNLLPALLAGRVDAIAGGFQNIEGAELAARGLHPVVLSTLRGAPLRRAGGGG